MASESRSAPPSDDPPAGVPEQAPTPRLSAAPPPEDTSTPTTPTRHNAPQPAIMNDADPATIKLAELLRHPEDLDKIASLKADFTRKKAAVDGQLKHGLRDQLEITQSGMASITDGQRTISLIKEEMMLIDKLCAEAQNMIHDFPHVNLVAQTHRNFGAVEKMKLDIDTFEEQLGELEVLLEQDEQDPENQPNLLAVHFGLSELRKFRDSAMEQIAGSPEEEQLCLELVDNLQLSSGATLRDYFDRLDRVVETFDHHVGAASMNLIPFVQSGNHGMVVRLSIIVGEEEKIDKRITAVQTAKREYKELASRFESIANGPKQLRGYKEKLLKAIEMAAQDQIDVSNQAFVEDPDRLEKSVRWFFNDLNTVKIGMIPLMPRKWKIFRTYVDIYHKLMHDWLITYVDDEAIAPTHMLAIIHWEEKYYKKMHKLGIDTQTLHPNLLDNRGAELVRDYRQLIIKAVEQWMDRMMNVDKEAFFSRTEGSLDTDVNGCLRTKTLGDMWSMLREQLQVSKSSNRTDVNEGVINAMIKALISRQRLWEELVDAELEKYTSLAAADQEGMQPLQDWLVAIANDQIACIDDGIEENPSEDAKSYLTRFATDAGERDTISKQYPETLETHLETLRNGYVDLGTHCITVFVRLVFDVDFRAILPEFFTPAWYASKRIAQITSTFQDYVADYETVLHPSLTGILVEELADELLVRYLSSVHNKGVKFRRTDPYEAKIADDLQVVFEFFAAYPSGPAIKEKWRVVERFVALLKVEKHAVVGVYEEFKMEYWDLSMSWVEQVLRCRDDADRGLLREVKARAGSVEVERRAETIMGKVK